MFGIPVSCLMAVASRVRTGGVIINEHILTAEQTRLHVAVLSRWFDFIHISELPARLDKVSGKPFCLMTFDDGKRSNATQVAPELWRLGVPAVFYLPTDSVTCGTPLWFDRYNALVNKLGYVPEGLEKGELKQLPLAALSAKLDELCEMHGAAVDVGSDNVRPMTWDEARVLARQGFVMGAHGKTHAILTRETRETALREIELSIHQVSAEVGMPCVTFAFPNGNYSRELAQHALRSGAETTMTTEPTWVDSGFPLWRLPRIQLFGAFTPERIELKLAAAAVGRVLSNPDGTGKEYCRVNRLKEYRAEPVAGD